ncbi:GNAT family N-acetyltransferase [Deinococcus terrestris]|uniref:GNAT family N-acetyltransferase n=1 Tax=Deinococcus terrestris TaxID=2651870 RepID=UPI002AD2DCA6|nr:GNAT family N-acetyltransferase [Deinococcus terrestris]
MPFTVASGSLPSLPELLSLYGSVGWTSYTRDPQALARAVGQSGFVWTARDEAGALIGLARGVTDDVSLLYVQDLLVRPEWRRQGVGRALMGAVLERYAHVMQMVLLTDDRPEQLAFNRSLGFHNTRDLVNTPTNAFYRTTHAKLS